MKKHGNQSKAPSSEPRTEQPAREMKPADDFAKQLQAMFLSEFGETDDLEDAGRSSSGPLPDRDDASVDDCKPYKLNINEALQKTRSDSHGAEAAASEESAPEGQVLSRRALRAMRKAEKRSRRALAEAASDEQPTEAPAPAEETPVFEEDVLAQTEAVSDQPATEASEPAPAPAAETAETGNAGAEPAEGGDGWSDDELFAAVDRLLARGRFRAGDQKADPRADAAEEAPKSAPKAAKNPAQPKPAASAADPMQATRQIPARPAQRPADGDTRAFSLSGARAASGGSVTRDTLPSLDELFPMTAQAAESAPAETAETPERKRRRHAEAPSEEAYMPAEIPAEEISATTAAAAEEAAAPAGTPAEQASEPAADLPEQTAPAAEIPAPDRKAGSEPRPKKHGWLYRLLHPAVEAPDDFGTDDSFLFGDESVPEDMVPQAEDLLPDQLPLTGFHPRPTNSSGGWGLPNQLPLDDSFEPGIRRQDRDPDEIPAWLQEYRDSGEAPADAEIPDWIKGLSASDQGTIPMQSFFREDEQPEAEPAEPPVPQSAPVREEYGPEGPDLIPQVRMQGGSDGPRSGVFHLEDLLAAAVPMEEVPPAFSSARGASDAKKTRRRSSSVRIPPEIPSEISTVEENTAGLTPADPQPRAERPAASRPQRRPVFDDDLFDPRVPITAKPAESPAPAKQPPHRVEANESAERPQRRAETSEPAARIPAERPAAEPQAPAEPARDLQREPSAFPGAPAAAGTPVETAPAPQSDSSAEPESPAETAPAQAAGSDEAVDSTKAAATGTAAVPAAAAAARPSESASQTAGETVYSASVRRPLRERAEGQGAQVRQPRREPAARPAPARRKAQAPRPEVDALHPDEAYRKYVKVLSSLGFRVVVTGLFTLLSLFFTLYLSLNWRFLPDIFSGGTTVYLLLALLIAMFATNHRLYGEAARSLFRKEHSPDLLLIPATLFTALDTFRAADQLRPQFTVVIGLLLMISLWGKYDRYMGLTLTVRQLREKEPTAGVAEVQDITKGSRGLIRTAPDVDRFMQKLETRDLCTKSTSIYVPVALLSGLVITLLIAFGLDEDLFWTGSLIFIGCTPLAAFLAYPRLLRLLSLRLADAGAALCGYHGAEVFGGEHSILIGDDDIFPEGSLRLNGFKVYNGNPDRIIAYAAAATRRSVSALSPLFEELLRAHACRRYSVDSFRYYDSGGIGATIIGDVVLMGSLDFMRHMGVHMDRGTKVRQAVYVSINGELAGVFAVKYAAPEKLRKGLAAIAGNRHFKGILVTRTFLGTPGFLKAKFGIPTGAFAYPSTKERLRLSETEMRDSGDQGAVLTEDSFSGFAQAAAGGRMLRSATVLATVLTILSGIAGLLLTAVLAALPATETATAFNLLLYVGAWLLPTLLLTSWARHF